MEKSKAPFAGIAAILALAALIVFLFLPALKFGADDPATYTGFQVLFGYTDKGEILGQTVDIDVLAFSTLSFVGIIGLLVGFILNALSAANRNKLFILVGTIGLFVGTVLVFLTAQVYVKGNEFQTLADILDVFGGEITVNLGIGTIIGGSLAGLSTLFSGFELIRK